MSTPSLPPLFQRHRLWLSLCAVLLIVALTPAPAQATSLPPLFSESLYAGNLYHPTLMAFAPDGRLFVAEQRGALRVIENGVLLPDPFVSIDVNDSGERGLLGIAFDPNFATNQYIYVYYTTAEPPIHNRISRFTANGNTAVPGSEVVLVDLDDLSGATNHNGGALHFGLDGKLYAAAGDNANGSNAQTLSNRHGKILRYNRDGTIPGDNPFYDETTGANRAIWAYGLRNPFNFAVQPGSGRIFINEVGANTWEEINEGIAGANYGWPETEGPTNLPQFRAPLYAYQHGGSPVSGCAITGGTFYNPATPQFPAQYVGSYFFGDYCDNWIRRYDPVTQTVHNFAFNTAHNLVDLKVGPDGSLYYLARGSGTTPVGVYRISYTPPTAPIISVNPTDQITAVGEGATFTCRGDGSPRPTYRWQRDGTDIPNATRASYTLAITKLSDDGATFRCVATNSLGSAASESARLTVIDGKRPAPTIQLPTAGSTYQAGQTITFSGTATDAEDGALPASAFTWEVVFHHDEHIHPILPPTTGITSGSFDISTDTHETVNIWYRIKLKVVDSTGLTRTIYRDIHPQVGRVSFLTIPSGLRVRVNGRTRITPHTIREVVGVNLFVQAITPQTIGLTRWDFESWSDSGGAGHTITVLPGNSTYTATFFGCPVYPNPSPDTAAPRRNLFTTSTPTLSWSRVAWAQGYAVQVDNARNFSHPEFEVNTLDANTLAVTTDALRDCTYYWRVRAKRPDGGWGNWSQPESFIIDTP